MTEYTVKIPTDSIITHTIVEQVTLRDQFAMAALTGFMGSGDCATGNHDATARLAYRFADAMLETRKEKK
jgi:hypothetical protein